ncbi:hypothetical protein NLM31_37995 [Bradyrhizobium sp. CCGUVB4N]|uniref:hypothetical protein n=1 Tax=Bradyrhizobium sp. CCGUVB4N TaxID=2949631 RepID=UPI0020B2F64F|nr:hypothetical protein [Bradyrhizobium sp. CCGUVB4N]MCP3386189.1 hypothetical protein [Bradyrhizobium sp. CCGUVB4N]
MDDFKIGSPEHALALADCLEGVEEASLGPSDIELCVKALRDHARHGRIRAIGKIYADGEITIEVLEGCLDRLAIAMQRAPQGGEVYLPIFERLETEIGAKKASESTMARARRRYQTIESSARPAS